jgi:hypothetical protein
MKWMTAVGLVFSLALGSMSPVDADSQTGDVQIVIQRRKLAPGWSVVLGQFACPADATSLLWTEKYSDGTSRTWELDPTNVSYFETWSTGMPAWLALYTELDIPPGPLTLILECLTGPPAEIVGQMTIDLEVIAPFTDVPQGAFYAKSVTWAQLADVTTGTSATMFSPDEAVSRWQMALFLNRMFGLIGDNTWPNQDGFTDTAHLRAEFRQAIGWLANTGITTGVGSGLFDPEAVVTRWQMALFLKRFAEHLGVDKAWANLDGFTDTGHLRDEFRQAIGWLATTEITTGVGPGLFDPDGVVTRSQMVTFLHRLATYLNSALTPDP